MIVYSKILNNYSDIYLIKLLRNNKFFWDYKFFFDQLSKRDILVLVKSLIFRNKKVVFVNFEGVSHSLFYKKPFTLADFVFGYQKGKKNIYWNIFFDEVAKNNHVDQKFKNKSINNLINKTCFVSCNTTKIKFIQTKYPELYKELDIYGNYHMPIEKTANQFDGLIKSGNILDRSYNSLSVTSRYMASLCAENNFEEGYAQCSALWSLRALTPVILITQKCRKNFIRPEFYIDFHDYLRMTQVQKLNAINKVQERLCSGESYLTNLTKDYIEFFNDSFSSNIEPDIKKIIHQSKVFREKFLLI